MRVRAIGVVIGVALFGVLAPLALGAAGSHQGKTSFKATGWRVWVPNASGLAVPRKAKLNSTYKLCSMSALNELEFDYSYKNAVTHGSLYTLILSGPSGAPVKLRFATEKSTGRAVEGWSNGALPPITANPSDPGKYTVEIRKGSKTLTRGSITLAATNTTCS
jgi:hypothetical protein